jgi:hypothetical protein
VPVHLPAEDVPGGAHVTSWVRADRAELDAPPAEAWPFETVEYAGRG